jgi:hypothetical protein
LSELTTWLGNGSRSVGIGAKLRKAGEHAGRSTSAGATSRAPRTCRRNANGAVAAQWATVMQPRLWAIRITGVLSAAMASASAATQSSRRGVSQSACSTRALLGRLFCQCSANDLLAILASPARSGNESTRCAWVCPPAAFSVAGQYRDGIYIR